MAPVITRVGWRRIGLAVAIIVACPPCISGVKAYRNEYLAARHAAKLRPVLQADPRFMHVGLEADLPMGGVLVLQGKVNNDDDKIALLAIVAASNPPVDTRCDVQTPTDSPRPLDQ